MIMTVFSVVVMFLLFSVTVFVHELGHFLVARRCGMVVDVFSIGFGPAIFKRRLRGVTYKIGCIPFGGYVALPQMDAINETAPDPEHPEIERKLPPVAPWKRILVAVAGAGGNFLLAVLIAWLVYWIGKPSSPRERNCLVGYVATNSAAYVQGLRIGDEIYAANDVPVATWEDLLLNAALNTQVVIRAHGGGGEDRTLVLPTEKNPLGVLSIPGIDSITFCNVASVVPGSSAEQAGLLPGDQIIAYNGIKLFSREHLIDLVSQTTGQTIPAEILRAGAPLTVQVTPRFDPELGRALIGIFFNTVDMDFDTIAHPKPWDQLRQHATAIFRFLQALVTPKEAKAASQAVGGPVSILFMLWLMLKQSFMLALWFTGFLNVNLAILNLLPLFVLDGGHVVLALWEMVTRRRMNAAVVNTTLNAFAALLIALFIFLTYRDVARWIWPLFRREPPTAAPAAVTNGHPAVAAPAPVAPGGE